MTQIGRYEIVRKTGQTPLGTIYEAIDSATRRTVAIQATADQSSEVFSATNIRAQAAVQESSESLVRLNHPNIVNLLAVERAEGKLFLVMEHSGGRPLTEYLAQRRTSASELTKLIAGAAAGLDYAHANGMFHPGLTPRHLLVSAQGVVKVAGFEIPALEAFLDSAGEAELSELRNSLPYRAPEFLCGETIDGRTDQFAMAAITYELLTGQKLFRYESPIETMASIVSGEKPDLGLVETRSSPAFRRVLERALSPEAGDRYSSCSRMAEDLALALARKAAQPTVVRNTPAREVARTPQPRPISSQIQDYQRGNRHRIRWMIAATVLVSLLMVALIVSQMRNQTARQPAHTKPVVIRSESRTKETAVSPAPAPPEKEPEVTQTQPEAPPVAKPKPRPKSPASSRGSEFKGPFADPQ